MRAVILMLLAFLLGFSAHSFVPQQEINLNPVVVEKEKIVPVYINRTEYLPRPCPVSVHFVESRAYLEKFLKEDRTDANRYMDGIKECDEFAWELVRNAKSVGIYAYPYILDDHMLVAFPYDIKYTGEGMEVYQYLVEPQTDRIAEELVLK